MNWAEKYLGLKWLTGGRDANVGLDCWGLLRYVYHSEFGIELSTYAGEPGALSSSAEITEGELIQSDKWVEVVNSQPEPGDVVILGGSTGFSHVGIYIITTTPSLLHIAAGRQSAIATLRDMQRIGFSQTKFYRHVDRISDR